MPIADYSTALVTGASSGFGAACVRALRQRGLAVIATARRADRLAALAEETGCTPLTLDLHDTDAVYAALGGLEVDVLVNNAGLGRGQAGFLTASPSDIDEVIQVNVAAAIHVVRAVAGGMVERRRGHIVNIGSIAGLYPIGFSIYGASKGAIHMFGQHLRIDLKGTGVRLTEICPGRANTEFFDTAFATDAERQAQRSAFELLEPDDIAAAVVFAVDAPWRTNISLIEVQPTEQIPGGVQIAPVGKN
jgi:NADP-dependent 3-hydroxy acid dehydrogenase YdfG